MENPSPRTSSPATAVSQILGVALLFASNGIMLAGLLPWYPVLKSEWGLSGTVFGIVVACVSAGSLASANIPALAARRFGPSRAIIYGTLVMAIALLAAAHAPSALLLALALAAVGFLDPVVDVAQNMVAVRVQEGQERSWMSSWHACWSLGAALSGAAATWAVAHIPMTAHIALNAVASFLAAAAGCWLLAGSPSLRGARGVTDDQAAASSGDEGKRGGASISLLVVLPLVLVAVSGTMVEEVANSWAALAAHQLGSLRVERAGVAFSVMVAAQCVGRFAGDPMINRFGRVRVARWGGLGIATGGVLVVLSASPSMVLAGLALAGFGCATTVPSVFVAAAKLPGLREGAGITLVSWLMRLGYLGTSPLIGVVSDMTSLRVALGLLCLGGLTIVLWAGKLRGR